MKTFSVCCGTVLHQKPVVQIRSMVSKTKYTMRNLREHFGSL